MDYFIRGKPLLSLEYIIVRIFGIILGSMLAWIIFYLAEKSYTYTVIGMFVGIFAGILGAKFFGVGVFPGIVGGVLFGAYIGYCIDKLLLKWR